MAMSPELVQVIDQFNGINTSDDEVIEDEHQFNKMDNFYIDGSNHELKVRPGFIELGQDRWPFAVQYLSRHNTYLQDCILGFNPTVGEGVARRDYDGWLTNMQNEVPTTTVFQGRVTSSVMYIDKEYFFGPGTAKDITWAIDLAANNSGGASNTTVDIYIEQSSYRTELRQDESNNPFRGGAGVYTASTLVQTDTVTGIIAAVGSNVYKSYTGTLTLNAQCYWARLSIRLTNAADPIGNKRIRVKNPNIHSTNYSTQSNRIESFDFRDFTHNWSRRVVTPSANPTNEITILAGNLATQTTCTIIDLGGGAIEMYPDVVAKASNLVNVGIEVMSIPIKYYFGPYTYYMNFSTFTAPPFLGVHMFKDRCWGFNEEESRLWFSDVGNPASWPTTNFIDIGNNDEKITAVFGLQDKLIIFKDSSIWFLYVTASTTTWNLRKASDSYGCSSMYTVKQQDNYVYFVSVNGVHRTDGTGFETISDQIENVFNNRSIQSWAYFFDHAGFWRGHYIVSLTGDSTTILYCYNIALGIWYTWTISSYSKLGFFIEDDLQSTWGPGLLACSTGEQTYILPANQRVSRLVLLPIDPIGRLDANMIYTDSDNPYVATLYTKSYYFEDLMSWKKLKMMDLVMEGNANVSFQSIVDGNTSVVNAAIAKDTNTSTSVAVPGPSPIVSFKAKINAICKTARLHYVITPRLPLGHNQQFTSSKQVNQYGTTNFVTTVGSLAYEYPRPLLPDGYGYRMAPKSAGGQIAVLNSPYIAVLPSVSCTIAYGLAQLVVQGGNTRYVAFEEFTSAFVSLGTTILQNNTGFAAVTDLLTHSPNMQATTAYIRVYFVNNTLATQWYIQYLTVTPNIGAETKTYGKAKISLYAIRMYLHKMRMNIKALT